MNDLLIAIACISVFLNCLLISLLISKEKIYRINNELVLLLQCKANRYRNSYKILKQSIIATRGEP